MPIGTVPPTSPLADDIYITIQAPPGYISGVPTDVFGVVGTASWGPDNVPVNMGSPYAALQAWGPISAASLTDPFDLATDLAIAFAQASSPDATGTLAGWAVRVTDGTDAEATGNLAGAVTSAALTATIGGTVTPTNTLTMTLTSTAISGSPLSLTYTVQAGDTTAKIAAGLAALVNANAALQAVDITAIAVGSVVNVYQPTALSPQATLSSSKSSGATETITGGTGSTTTAGGVLEALFTGVVGNAIVCALSAGAAVNTTTATLSLPTLNLVEVYPNLANATFFTLLKNALANGLSGVRGPSQIARIGTVNLAVGVPTVGSYTTSGGTDGRSGVTTSTLLGSNSSQPRTGLYALAGINPAPSVIWIVGCTDYADAASDVLGFGQSNASSSLFPLPSGTTTAGALTITQAQGIADPSFAWVSGDWIYWFDSINNVQRVVPPTAFIGGYICTTPPSESPGNSQVVGVNGTLRNNPVSGNQPYSETEIGQLEQAGIMFICNPIPAGAVFGIRHGQTTSLNAVTAPFEYWRMSTFLAKSFQATLGGYVDQLQSAQPNDPLRNSLKLELNNFLTSLQGANGSIGQIDSFSVVCTYSANGTPGNGVNTDTSIAAHYLYCLVRVKYLSSVRFFFLTIQGGTTVVTVGSTSGQQSPG